MADDHEQFLACHLPCQRSILNALLAGVRDLRCAEELQQEVAVVAWRRFADYRRDRPYLPWALGIVRNVLHRHWRDQGRDRRQLPLEAVEALVAAVEAEEPRLERERMALQDCLRGLSEEQRALVTARYRDAQPLAALAERLGQNLATVNMRLVRLRQGLLRCVERAIAAGIRP